MPSMMDPVPTVATKGLIPIERHKPAVDATDDEARRDGGKHRQRERPIMCPEKRGYDRAEGKARGDGKVESSCNDDESHSNRHHSSQRPLAKHVGDVGQAEE